MAMLRATKLTTPLARVSKNLHAKLEGAASAGSIKERPVRGCIDGMLRSGSLKPGGTVAVCTSGNAGVALLQVQNEFKQKGVDFNVKVFMPEAYVSKTVPQRIATTEGVHTEKAATFLSQHGRPRCLCPCDGDFITSLGHMKGLAAENEWTILDQHFDVNNMLSHRSTAEELFSQLPDLTDVVCTTGTGGTAAGLRAYLPSHVRVHARPAVSGSIDGITDVRRYGNFCDPNLLEGYGEGFFDAEEATMHQRELTDRYGISCGPSSGAAYGLARDIAESNPDANVAFIAADGNVAEVAAEAPMMPASFFTMGSPALHSTL
jgi:cysteine synthase